VRGEDEALFEAIEGALEALQTEGTLDALVERWVRR